MPDTEIEEKWKGYLCLSEEYTILEANPWLIDLLEYNLEGIRGCQFESILTHSSAVFLHIYFQAIMKLQGKVENLYLNIKTAAGDSIPILLNTIRRDKDGTVSYECYIAISPEKNF